MSTPLPNQTRSDVTRPRQQHHSCSATPTLMNVSPNDVPPPIRFAPDYDAMPVMLLCSLPAPSAPPEARRLPRLGPRAMRLAAAINGAPLPHLVGQGNLALFGLRTARMAAGLTQRDLEQRSKIRGAGDFERNAWASAKTARLFAAILRCTVADLLRIPDDE